MLKRILAVTCLIAITSFVGYRAGSAAPTEKSADQNSLAVRYAKAQLRLAELTLQKAQAMNRRVPSTISAPMIALFTDEVEFAKAQLDLAGRSGGFDPFQALLRRAELNLRNSETRLKKAVEADKLIPGTFDESDIERLRVNVELATVRLERGKSLVNAGAESKLQWQVELLNDDVARLKEQQAMIVQNRLSEFF